MLLLQILTNCLEVLLDQLLHCHYLQNFALAPSNLSPHYCFPHSEVVIVGDRPDLVAEARATWRPLTVLAWGETGSGSLWEARENGLAYVCEGQVCHQPVGTAAELAAQLGRGSQRS